MRSKASKSIENCGYYSMNAVLVSKNYFIEKIDFDSFSKIIYQTKEHPSTFFLDHLKRHSKSY